MTLPSFCYIMDIIKLLIMRGAKMRYVKLLIMLILLSIAAVGNCQNLQKAGETDVGTLYVDVDSVQSLSKSGQLYLAVFAEEQYTDAEFLKSLREEESLQNAVSAMYLYLFNNNGTEYTVAAHYIIDKDGNVCLDMGGETAVQQTKGNKEMLNVYTKALDALNKKVQQNKWLHNKSLLKNLWSTQNLREHCLLRLSACAGAYRKNL